MGKIVYFIKYCFREQNALRFMPIVFLIIGTSIIIGIILNKTNFANEIISFATLIVTICLILYAMIFILKRIYEIKSARLLHLIIVVRLFILYIFLILFSIFIMKMGPHSNVDVYLDIFLLYIGISFFSSIIFMLLIILSKSFPILHRIYKINASVNYFSYKQVLVIMCLLYLLFIKLILCFFNQKDINEYIFYVSCFILILIQIFIFYHSYPHETNDNVKITFLNLSGQDIMKNKIYLDTWNVKNLKEFRVFKIDLRALLPEGRTKANIRVLNHVYMKGPLSSADTKSYCEYIYFCVNNKYRDFNTKLTMDLSFELKGKKKAIRLSVLLDFISISNELVCSSYEVKDYYIHHHTILKKELEPVSYNNGFHYGRLFKKLYHYNFSFGPNNSYNTYNKLTNQNEFDTRKFVLHDDSYGIGKTTLDILYLFNIGYHPIVISPWEDNYDNDMLYLIFENVMRTTKKFIYCPNTTVFMFLFGTIVSLTPLIYFIINYIFSNLRFNEQFLNRFKEPFIFFDFAIGLFPGFISLIISIIVTCMFMPSIIIHAKDSTKIHQRFYLEKIKNQLDKKKIILMIEDIDRLKPDGIRNVFRLLSSINKVSASIHKVIGIITLSTENLKSYTELESDIDALNRKTIKAKVFTEYSKIESMKLYFKEYTEGIINSYGNSMNKIEFKKLLNIIPWDKTDFRDIQNLLDLIITNNCYDYSAIYSVLLNFYKANKNY